MSYTAIPYSPDLNAEIVHLQTHLWGDDLDRNTAYLQWKYTDNPYLDETLIHLVRCDGRLIGMRGMFGSLWEVDDPGSRHLLPYADDFVIVPDHRNRGVAARIMQACLEDARGRGYPLLINLSAGPVTFISSLAAGWRAGGSFRRVEYRSPSTASGSRLRTLVGRRLYERAAGIMRSLSGRHAFAHLDHSGVRTTSTLSVHREPRPRAMADLVRHLPWDGRIRHVRDERYFSWRFRNPLHEYRFLFAGVRDLHGYLVLQRQLSKWADPGLVNIVDCEAVDDRVRADLFDAALRFGRFDRVQTWSVGASPAMRELLGDHGFAAAEPGGVRARSSGLLLRRPEARAEDSSWRLGSRDPFSIDHWDLRMIYSMAG